MPTVEKDHQHNEKYGEKMSTAIVRHILVKDLSTAEVLKKQLQAGAEFAKLAKQHSICNSAKRGGELGWSLQVKQNAQFETAEKNILTGAAISFENGTAVTDSESLIPSIVTKTFSLVPGADQVVMTAAEGEGAGTQLYRAGDDATKANSVKLAVPGKTTKYKGTYETNLTWTLSDVPTNEVDPDPEA